ncbi:MAG: hypothetical protein H7336_07335 [Bacteriovorax sp.]|nr:hypothetical protein [Bacteriovorax sp.]
MVAGAVLKCILLAKFHIDIVETPISEYAMATMNKVHNGVQFEATVLEGRMNSISIEIPDVAKTMSYSTDYDQRTMGAKLEVKDEYATIDCEIN